MSAEIHRLADYTTKNHDNGDTTRSTTRAFIKRVDMNLININAQSFEYISRIAKGVYKTIGAGGDVCTNTDYILRVEYHVKSCNLHECMILLEMLDFYLRTPTISTSQEKSFIMHTRNKVFERVEFLKEPLRNLKFFYASKVLINFSSTSY